MFGISYASQIRRNDRVLPKKFDTAYLKTCNYYQNENHNYFSFRGDAGTCIWTDEERGAPIQRDPVSEVHTNNNVCKRSRTFFAWKPRLTVVSRLNEHSFSKTKNYLRGKSFNTSFIAGNITLLKHEAAFSAYEVVGEFGVG